MGQPAVAVRSGYPATVRWTSRALPPNQGAGNNLVEDHNLMTDSSGLIDPDNADFLAKDFSLQAGSPAIDSGTAVPVFDDFTGAPRPNGSAYDVGAFER